MKTLDNMPRYTVILLQLVAIGLLWARVEQVAIATDRAARMGELAITIARGQ